MSKRMIAVLLLGCVPMLPAPAVAAPASIETIAKRVVERLNVTGANAPIGTLDAAAKAVLATYPEARISSEMWLVYPMLELSSGNQRRCVTWSLTSPDRFTVRPTGRGTYITRIAEPRVTSAVIKRTVRQLEYALQSAHLFPTKPYTVAEVIEGVTALLGTDPEYVPRRSSSGITVTMLELAKMKVTATVDRRGRLVVK